jgi:hypothetical protein
MGRRRDGDVEDDGKGGENRREEGEDESNHEENEDSCTGGAEKQA